MEGMIFSHDIGVTLYFLCVCVHSFKWMPLPYCS